MGNYKYLTDRGLIYPDTSKIIDDVNKWWSDVSQDTTPVDPSSLEGRILDAETTARLETLNACANVVNQINPEIASGVFLDSLCKLTGIERRGAESSTIECVLKGVEGTLVIKGSKASDKNNNNWLCGSDTVIKKDGTQTTFVAEKTGEIYAGVGDVNKITTSIEGWEEINSIANATLGRDSQTDQSLRHDRRIFIGKNSKGNAFSVLAAIGSLEGVRKATFQENFKETKETIRGIEMKPHSCYVCVDGGIDDEIAGAYQSSKSAGCDYSYSSKTKSVTWQDPYSYQYIDVYFDRPVLKKIKVVIDVRMTASASLLEDIKELIYKYGKECKNDSGFSLGVDLSPFEIANYLISQLTNVSVVSCEIGIHGAAVSCKTIVNKIFEKVDLAKEDITVRAVT